MNTTNPTLTKTNASTQALIGLGLGLLALALPGKAHSATESAKRPGRTVRVSHARELLGKSFRRSVVSNLVENEAVDVADYVHAQVEARLPKQWKTSTDKLTKAILAEADKNGFDPLFVMAVIQTESSFKPDQIGGVGEVGLMQIRPETAQWLSKRLGLKWGGRESLFDPVVNVRLGTAYMAMLRKDFDSKSNRYIAAYNMGSGNVRKLAAKSIEPKEYPSRILNHYMKLYTDLHKAQEVREALKKNMAASVFFLAQS